MGKVYKQGIASPKGFDLTAGEPVDQREIVEFYTDLSSLANTYVGIEVKVVENNYEKYKLMGLPSSLLSNWLVIAPGVGPAGPQGEPGIDGADGADGPTGPTGAAGTPGADGQGIPVAGNIGQALVKAGITDYDTKWATIELAQSTNYRESLALGRDFIDASNSSEILTDFNDAVNGGVHATVYVEEFNKWFVFDRTSSPSVYIFEDLEDLTSFTKIDVSKVGYTGVENASYNASKGRIYFSISDNTYSQTDVLIKAIDVSSNAVTTIIEYNTGVNAGAAVCASIGNFIYVMEGNYSWKFNKFDTAGNFIDSIASGTTVNIAHSTSYNDTHLYISTFVSYNEVYQVIELDLVTFTVTQLQSVIIPGGDTVGGTSGFTNQSTLVGPYIYIGTENFTTNYIVKLNKDNLSSYQLIDVRKNAITDNIYTTKEFQEKLYYAGSNDLFGYIDLKSGENALLINPFPYSINEISITNEIMLFGGFDVYPVSGTGFVAKGKYFESIEPIEKAETDPIWNAASSNVPRLDADNTFTGENIFSGGDDVTIQDDYGSGNLKFNDTDSGYNHSFFMNSLGTMIYQPDGSGAAIGNNHLRVNQIYNHTVGFVINDYGNSPFGKAEFGWNGWEFAINLNTSVFGTETFKVKDNGNDILTATSSGTTILNALTAGSIIKSGATADDILLGDGTTTSLGGLGGGDVSKVGTPVDNQIGVWTGDGTIEGTTGLTFDSSINRLTVGGSVVSDGNLDVRGVIRTYDGISFRHILNYPSGPDYGSLTQSYTNNQMSLSSFESVHLNPTQGNPDKTNEFATVDGDFGIGNGYNKPTEALDVTGNAIISGTINASNLSNTNTGDDAVNSNYSGLVTNATHTGDVTGDVALTIAAGAVDIAMLSATGTPSATNFLRGDNTWATPAGSGNVSTAGTPVINDFARFTGSTDIEGRSYAEVKADLNLEIGTDIDAIGTDNSDNNAVNTLYANDYRAANFVAETDYSAQIHSNITALNAVSGTNTGDQTTIVGISSTKAQFNTAVSDGTILYSGDVTSFPGFSTLSGDYGYTEPTHSWSEITSKPTTLSGFGISDTKANFNTTLSDGSFLFVGDAPTSHTHTASDITDFDTEVANNTAVTANTAKNTNVITNLGYTASPTNGIVTSSDGSDATLSLANGTNAGLMTPDYFTNLANTSGSNTGDNATNSQYSGLVSNVSTSLSIGTITSTTFGITSDGGVNDVILPEANTSQAGLLGADKWDEIVANTAKDTNITQTITLTGDVNGSGTGSFAATIQPDSVTMDKIVDIATNTFLGRVTATTGTVEVLTNTQAKTALDLTGTNSGDEPAASTTVAGIVELAIASEVDTGTSTTLAITPDALEGSALQATVDILDETTINAQTGTTYTFVDSDKNKMVTLDNAAAITVTVSSALSLAIGAKIHLIQKGAGQVTVAVSSTTVNTAATLKLRAQWSSATLLQIAADVWVLIGDLEAA